VKVGHRFCRIAYQMVAGRQVFRHPGIQGRHYILDKLNAFHRLHNTATADWLGDLQAAIDQLPRDAYAAEAAPLHEQLRKIEERTKRGPQLLGDILPAIPRRASTIGVQSRASGEITPP
jgi:hypothetical protein